MLSREDRILSEILISRGLVAQERIEACTRLPVETTSGRSLVDLLVDRGEIAPDEAQRAAEEARALEESLVPEIEPGMRLGEFLLIRELGRGGMGIVFEAQQESLGRRVALKILPAGGALDERLAIRFLRESRAAARLRHPGIVPVYTSGRAGSVLYFAMQLIEGRTLAAAINEGALAPHDAARIAAEIARALEHAHGHGLVHRDVKPENILLSTAGHAMIADFGLVQEASGGDFTRSCHILGTPAYISPEQARGEAVSARSDVYSLGAVLYAMLSGSSPFSGAVSSVVLARVLTERPRSLHEVRPELHRSLVAICERAMASSPADRFASAAELAEALERHLAGGEALTATPSPQRHAKRSKKRLNLLVASTVAVAAVSVLGVYLLDGRPPPAFPGIEAAAASPFRLVSVTAGAKTTVSLSPDGRTTAYAGNADGDWDVYLQDMAGGEPTKLIASPNQAEFAPAFSPDGRSMAYVTGGMLATIHVMDLASGKSRPIIEHDASDLAWSADGREILFTDTIYSGPRTGAAPTKLLAVDVATGRIRALTGIYGAQPNVAPSGAVAFIGMGDGRMDIWLLPAGGGDAVRVTDDPAADWSPVWSNRGDELYFGSDRLGGGALFRVAVDPLTGRAHGDPVALSAPVLPGRFYLAYGGGDEGSLALLNTRHAGRLHRLSLAANDTGSGQRVEAILGRFQAARSPDVAPNGQSLVYTAITSQEDLAVGTLDGAEARLVTQDAFLDRAPRWAPDGSRIAFQSDRSGRMEIWSIAPDGSAPIQHTHSPTAATRPIWSPDGRQLAYTVEGVGAFVLSADGDAVAGEATAIEPLTDGRAPFEAFAWSPDGRLLVGSAQGIVVYSFGERTYRRLTDFGTAPAWLDEQRLVFVTDHEVHLLDTRSGETTRVFSFAPTRIEPTLALAPDGGSLFLSVATSPEELWRVALKD